MLLITGCVQVGTGKVYDTVHTVEYNSVWNIWRVYVTNDHGTGGEYASNSKGSYCIANPALVPMLEEFARTKEMVKMTISNYLWVWGCDYDSLITEVEKA